MLRNTITYIFNLEEGLKDKIELRFGSLMNSFINSNASDVLTFINFLDRKGLDKIDTNRTSNSIELNVLVIESLDLNLEKYFFDCGVDEIMELDKITESGFRRMINNGIYRKQFQNKQLLLEQELLDRLRTQSMGLFIAGMAHEINNPLTIAIGNLDKLIKKSNSFSDDRHIGKVFSSLRRISDIVRSIHNVSLNNSLSKHTKISLTQYLSLITSFYDKISNFDDVEIQNDIHEVCNEVFVHVSRETLDSIFNNLIANALEAAGNSERLNKKVSIRFFITENKDLSVLFLDNGSGINESISKRIFEPFFTTKTFGKSKGLGLGIVKMNMEKIGGDVSWISENNSGTCFIIRIPSAIIEYSFKEGNIEKKLDDYTVYLGEGKSSQFYKGSSSFIELLDNLPKNVETLNIQLERISRNYIEKCRFLTSWGLVRNVKVFTLSNLLQESTNKDS